MGVDAHFTESVYEQPDVTPFFTIATTSSGLPSIAIRFWKELCVNEYEPSSDRCPGNWACRSSQAFCPESMSTCSSRYHHISRSATVRRVKGRSSHRVQMEFPELRKRYWGRHFWARGYFCTTSGNITDEAILQYLRHHEPTGVSR